MLYISGSSVRTAVDFPIKIVVGSKVRLIKKSLWLTKTRSLFELVDIK